MNLNPLFFNKLPGNDNLKLLGLNQASSQTYLFSDIIKVCEDELEGDPTVKLKSSLTDLIPNLNSLELSAPSESKLTFMIGKVINSLDENGVEIKSDQFKLDKANITHSEIAFNSDELKTFLNELNSLLNNVQGITNVKTETDYKSSETESGNDDAGEEILSPDSIINILQNYDSIKLIVKTEGEKLTFVFSKTDRDTADNIKTDSDSSIDALLPIEGTSSSSKPNLAALSTAANNSEPVYTTNQNNAKQESASSGFYKIEIVHTALEQETANTSRAGKSPFLFNARSLHVINNFLAKYTSENKDTAETLNQNVTTDASADDFFITAVIEPVNSASDSANVIPIKNNSQLNLPNTNAGTPFEPILNDDQEEQISILGSRSSQAFNAESDLKRKLVFLNSTAKVEEESSSAQAKLAAANLDNKGNELEQNSSAGIFKITDKTNQEEQQKEIFMLNTRQSMKDLLNASDASAKNKINDAVQKNISTVDVENSTLNNSVAKNVESANNLAVSAEPVKNNRAERKENKSGQKIDAKQVISTEPQNGEKVFTSKENVRNDNVIPKVNDTNHSQNQSDAKHNDSHENSGSQSSPAVQAANENAAKADQSKEQTRNFVFEIGSNTEPKINRVDVNKTKTIEDLSSFNETLKVIKADEVITEINKYLQSNERQSITFQLTPENLGKVKLMVDYADNQLQASIEVENEQVKQHVQSSIEQLKSNLQSSGVQINNINVSISSNEQRYQKNSMPKKKNYSGADEIKVNAEKSSETQKKMGYNTYEYLA